MVTNNILRVAKYMKKQGEKILNITCNIAPSIIIRQFLKGEEIPPTGKPHPQTTSSHQSVAKMMIKVKIGLSLNPRDAEDF